MNNTKENLENKFFDGFTPKSLEVVQPIIPDKTWLKICDQHQHLPNSGGLCHVCELQNEIAQLHRELTFREAAIRCAFQNLEGNVNNPIPSLMAVRAAVQALRAYVK